MATWKTVNPKPSHTTYPRFPLCLWVSLALFWALLGLAPASNPLFAASSPLDRASDRLKQARAATLQAPSNPQLAWELAKACFDRADFSHTDKERERLAEEGIQSARTAVRLGTNSAPAHFYLAMNLGQLARTRTFSALGLVSEMEKELLKALDLDSKFHHGAAARSLAMLYQKAPGWPTSIGSRSKARVYFQKAIELDPGYPENLLCQLEAENKWGERKKVSEKLPRLQDLIRALEREAQTEGLLDDIADWKKRTEQLKPLPVGGGNIK